MTDTFTIIGDPHAKPDNLDKIETLFKIVEDLGNPAIWLGDLLDTKELVRGRCLNAYMRYFADSCLEHIVLVGNHDWFNLECKEHSLEPLKALPNVKIVDRLHQHDNLVFVPYMHDAKELYGIIRKFWDNPRNINKLTLFCHADIRGFDYGNGLISEDGLRPGDFDIFKMVVSGHYHKYQQTHNITYLGTPFSHSFGESNQDKYIGVLDTYKSVIDLLETPFPKHQTVTVDCSRYKTFVPDDDYYRVVLQGTQEEIDRFQRHDGVKYIEQPSNLKKSVITETLTPEQQFKKWAVDIKGYSLELVDRGLEILDNV